MSWRTAFGGGLSGALHVILVQSENTCRFGRLLRFTSPASERCRAS